MGLKEDLITELESTRREYHLLVESVPEETYRSPSANPAWSIGDVLYHITLGPPAIRAEVWMIRNAGWLFSTLLNNRTAGIFNWGNALFARHPKRISPASLTQAYDRGHAGLLASLQKMREADLSKSIKYPEAFPGGIFAADELVHFLKEILLRFPRNDPPVQIDLSFGRYCIERCADAGNF